MEWPGLVHNNSSLFFWFTLISKNLKLSTCIILSIIILGLGNLILFSSTPSLMPLQCQRKKTTIYLSKLFVVLLKMCLSFTIQSSHVVLGLILPLLSTVVTLNICFIFLSSFILYCLFSTMRPNDVSSSSSRVLFFFILSLLALLWCSFKPHSLKLYLIRLVWTWFEYLSWRGEPSVD